MKAYTDIEQGRKLAEILPIESADMCFNISQRYNMPPLMTPYSKFNEFFNMEKTPDFLIPCWSLAALLSVLPTLDDRNAILCKDIRYNKWHICYHSTATLSIIDTERYDNLVDACYDMIIKLHEQKLL